MRLEDLSALQRLILPDAWQAQAIAALREGKDGVIDAPTGAGKTYVFERWAEQSNFSRRAIFTVPTRALANDKYAEWKQRGWKVGIVTGDLTISPTAPVVVATLEAVQGLVTRRQTASGPACDLLVIDEYHWLADPYRGNHYEGVLLGVDPGVQLLLLSGAVANPGDVAAWLGRMGRRVEVVQTKRRPVPLEEIDVDELTHGLPRSVQGIWAKRVAGALREGLGPVLVFAPHRQDAERLARQFARELPLAEPLALTREQEELAGQELARLLRQRVAFHHSGLTYGQRAGLIEPLAKAGQLRAVVATLGLASGINFSLRSVMITAASYRFDQIEREIAPHDLLQMVGRAGRRGLDDVGYVLCAPDLPRLRRAAPLRLKRAQPLPWAFMLRAISDEEPTSKTLARLSLRFFSEEPLRLGTEATAGAGPEKLCHQETDTGRARLVRRERNPFEGCRTCALRPDCLALDPAPTVAWQWQRVGVLDRELRLTPRGEIVSAFLGPEGLALAAALEDRKYPLDDLLFDCANLYASDRFAGTNPRRLGRLAAACEQAYRRTSVEGYLWEGLPVHYGYGASDVVKALVAEGARARELAILQEQAGRGDVDRLMTEWRSLLRQVAAATPLRARLNAGPSHLHLADRWDNFRALARVTLGENKADALPALPALTAEQRRPVNHQLLRLALSR